jgi:hypothetical protein
LGDPIEGDLMTTTATDRTKLARESYGAYESGDRGSLERLLCDDFSFYSPYDDGIDRATYFERCWPNHETISAFDFKRLVALDADEVLVTYVVTKSDGRRFCNTEVLQFSGDRIRRAEVYFGWDVE